MVTKFHNPIFSKHDECISCRQQIDQLFTDLSTKLADRKQVLSVKLYGIANRYSSAKYNFKQLETMKIKQQAILASITRMGGLITAETKQSLEEAFCKTDLSCNNWKAKIEEFSYICFKYHTIGSINSINRLGSIKVIARPFSEAILSDIGRTSDEDNFLTRLNQCRQQIDQLFTDLSTKLDDRKQVLSVEFDEIENRYTSAKYNFKQLETMKIKQQAIIASMERMGGLITAETKQSLLEAFRQTDLSCNNWKAEIEEFSNISFKYDTTRPLNSIHQLGAITVNTKPDAHTILSDAGGIRHEDENRLKSGVQVGITPTIIPQQYTENYTRDYVEACCFCCWLIIANFILIIWPMLIWILLFIGLSSHKAIFILGLILAFFSLYYILSLYIG